MDWLGGNFCQEFANSSSITDIVDLVENSAINKNSSDADISEEWFASNSVVPGSQGQMTSVGEPAPTSVAEPTLSQEPIFSAADTTADSSGVSYHIYLKYKLYLNPF